MICKLKEHEVYDSLVDAIEDDRLSRHVSYVPASELSKDNWVFVAQRVSNEDFEKLVWDKASFVTTIEDKNDIQ